MPFLFIPLALVVLVVLSVVTLPISIMQRYRMGTARRLARPWVAAFNVFGFLISTGLFLVTAAISTPWVPTALRFSAAGLVGGVALGLFGVAITRWERTSDALHFTPNKWLVLSLTVGVSLRICFGVWRMWHAWHASSEDHSWLATSGLAGSMAAGAVVLGYYLAFWIGVSRRIRRHSRERRAVV